MQDLVYKCLNDKCNLVFHGVGKEGVNCPVCRAAVVPICKFKNYNSKDIPSYNDLKRTNLMYRIGTIKVSSILIKENPEQVLKVLRDILVTDVKIEKTVYDYIYHYRGMSKYFDVVHKGEKIPVYDVICHKVNGSFKCSFRRVDDD